MTKERQTEQKGKAFGSPEREYEQQKPITETSMGMSKDRKFFIHKTTITDIKPVKYVETVLENKER